MKRVEGVLTIHYETGYEGSPWAIQDKNYIDMSKAVNGLGGWSYEGLNILKHGDYLEIYKEDKLVWNGIVNIDTDYKRIPWYIFRSMSGELVREYFAGEYTAIMERYDVNLATYIYVSAKIFSLRAIGISDDDPEIETLVDSLDAVWIKLDYGERRFVEAWASRVGIPANEH